MQGRKYFWFPSNIKFLKGILKRMQKGNVSINDWKNLYLTITTLVKIGEYLIERKISLNILNEKLSHFGDDLIRIASILVEMVCFANRISTMCSLS